MLRARKSHREDSLDAQPSDLTAPALTRKARDFGALLALLMDVVR
jgi:hypothetical protein